VTRRAARIAALPASRLDPRAIATVPRLRPGTVRSHRKHAFERTGADNQIAFTALVRGFVRTFH
jgi:DNA-binding CsgD family transcriptional regulator